MTDRITRWAVPTILVTLAACTDPSGPDATAALLAPPAALAVVGDGEVNTAFEFDPVLQCGATGTVRVTLTGVQPPALEVPIEIALVVDESGSIDSSEFQQMANAAGSFVGGLTLRGEESPTGGAQVAVVKYSSAAALRLPLSSVRPQIMGTINSRFYPGGSTYTDQGLQTARMELASIRARAGANRVILLLTDGLSTNPPAALNQAMAAKAAGIRVFALGVAGAQLSELQSLASPNSAFYVSQFDQLAAAFDQIADEIVFPAAKAVKLSLEVGPGLVLGAAPTASKGTVTVVGNALSLSLTELGAETVTLEYQVTHDPATAPAGGALLAATDVRVMGQVPQTGGGFSEELEDAVVTVNCDTTAPEITAEVAGTLGDNGWYVSDVTVSWLVSDAETAITEQVGCEAVSIVTDTAADELTCTATSAGGAASETVTVKRDATAPTVVYSGALATYGLMDEVAITCAASDALSGLASDTCVDLTGPAYGFDLGVNELSATATDNAGNEGGSSVAFVVAPSLEGLCELVESFVSGGTASSMCSKLDAAARSVARGNANAAAGQIGAFINQANAQSGKSLTADEAALLAAIAGSLL